MNRIPILILIGLLGACGGGSGTDIQTAALRGTVVDSTGTARALSGVDVSVSETGDQAFTAADGSFSFDQLPAGSLTVRVGDDVIQITGIRGGDDIDLKILVNGSEIVAIERNNLMRGEAENKVRTGQYEAEVEIESEVGEEEFKAEIEFFDPGTEVEFYLVDPDGVFDPILLGTAFAGTDGEAEIELDTDDGDTLPLGALSVHELSGLIVSFVLASTGDELVRVTVPEIREWSEDHDGHDDDHDGDDDDDHDDDDHDDDDHDDDESDDD